MAFFITFEGVEGCGKTTQIKLLAEALKKQGHKVRLTREPGGCPIADDIRAILLHPDNTQLVPTAELLLYAAARAQHVEEVIRPALSRGEIVLCDRFTDATMAYQGYGRALDRDLIAQLNTVATGGIVPHITLLLDMPAEEGLKRALQRNSGSELEHEGRFEQEALDFHQQVRRGYLELARNDSARFRRIDAVGTPDQVAKRVKQAVDALIAPGGHP